MPATSEKQRRLMGAELARKRAGRRTKTGMTESQLEDFAMKKPKSKMPAGASMKGRWGDIGKHRQKEGVKAGGFSNGRTVDCTAALPWPGIDAAYDAKGLTKAGSKSR